MKKHLLFTLLALVMIIQAGISQTYIWGGPGDKNSEFNGGLNDWTVKAISPNDNALWIWEADGKPDKGAYSGKANQQAIQSPSVSNGAMVFDSDFYDNAGTPGNFGKGIAPSPQVGELISPTFSCAGRTSVWLKFNQYFRQYQSTTNIAVSIDGGATWKDPITFNGDIPLNSATAPNSQILYDITSIAAGHANVKIKFIFNADYYYWVIDDVYVLEAPAGDPKIMGTWYSPMHYGIPQNMANRDSMYFIMDVNNTGGQALTGVEGKVTLYNDNLQKVFYTESKTFDLEKQDTFRVLFNSFMPTHDLDTGLYVVLYEVISEQAATATGKEFVQYFRIYPNLFAKKEGSLNVYNTKCRNTDSTVDAGVSFQGSGTAGPIYDAYNLNYYKLGDWVTNPNFHVRAVSSTISNAMSGSGNISYPGTIRVFELADTLDNLLWNFDFTDGIGLDGKESKQLKYIGYGFKQIENVANYAYVDVDVTDLDENGYIELKPNGKYFVAALWEKGTRYYHAYDNTNSGGNKRFYYFLNNLYQTVSYVYTSNDQRFYLIGEDYGAWVIDLNLQIWGDFKSASEDQLLPANTVTLLENPVRNVLSVDLDFENSIDQATMVIHDLNGSIIDMRNVYNLKQSTETFQVGNFPAGQYIFTIFTKDKLLSKKFVVIK
jgi:hypothetical protein